MHIGGRIFGAGLLVSLVGLTPAATAQPPRAPTLLVVLVVDQMRFDYLDRMKDLWTRGLKRLVADGAVFDRNAYPYLQTVTCVGHATIATGSFPATHGIILNAWWRGTRNASCTDDSAVSSVAYEPGSEVVGHSPNQLLVPTIGDRLRERTRASRVVTMSIKPRSAIMLAGHEGIVTWRDDKNVWATSTSYAHSPNAEVQKFITSTPHRLERDAVWTPLLGPGAYTGPDDGAGEVAPRGWTATFPHPLAGAPGTSEAQFEVLWETSPYADAYLGSMATSLLRQLRLGQGPAVDFLGVSFSALDYVGHDFGPDSHEVQDTLLRLDHTIGTLLDALDRQVGREGYVLALTADHGVAPVPEARRLAGLDGGRVVTQQLGQVANDALGRVLGPGQHVVRTEYTQVYLSAAARQRIVEDPEVLRPALAALAAVPGVERALPSTALAGHRSSADPVVRAAALSYVPGRSGQIVVIPKAYYLMGAATATGTTHGTHHEYDQHVPLIFFGAGVKPGRYQDPATPADIAPTLAATVGLTLRGADGVAHTQAFRAR